MTALANLEAALTTEPDEFALWWAMIVTSYSGQVIANDGGLARSTAACRWSRSVTEDQFRRLCASFMEFLEHPIAPNECALYELREQCGAIRLGVIRLMLVGMEKGENRNLIPEFQELMSRLDELQDCN